MTDGKKLEQQPTPQNQGVEATQPASETSEFAKEVEETEVVVKTKQELNPLEKAVEEQQVNKPRGIEIEVEVGSGNTGNSAIESNPEQQEAVKSVKDNLSMLEALLRKVKYKEFSSQLEVIKKLYDLADKHPKVFAQKMNPSLGSEITSEVSALTSALDKKSFLGIGEKNQVENALRGFSVLETNLRHVESALGLPSSVDTKENDTNSAAETKTEQKETANQTAEGLIDPSLIQMTMINGQVAYVPAGNNFSALLSQLLPEYGNVPENGFNKQPSVRLNVPGPGSYMKKYARGIKRDTKKFERKVGTKEDVINLLTAMQDNLKAKMIAYNALNKLNQFAPVSLEVQNMNYHFMQQAKEFLKNPNYVPQPYFPKYPGINIPGIRGGVENHGFNQQGLDSWYGATGVNPQECKNSGGVVGWLFDKIANNSNMPTKTKNALTGIGQLAAGIGFGIWGFKKLFKAFSIFSSDEKKRNEGLKALGWLGGIFVGAPMLTGYNAWDILFKANPKDVFKNVKKFSNETFGSKFDLVDSPTVTHSQLYPAYGNILLGDMKVGDYKDYFTQDSSGKLVFDIAKYEQVLLTQAAANPNDDKIKAQLQLLQMSKKDKTIQDIMTNYITRTGANPFNNSVNPKLTGNELYSQYVKNQNEVLELLDKAKLTIKNQQKFDEIVMNELGKGEKPTVEQLIKAGVVEAVADAKPEAQETPQPKITILPDGTRIIATPKTKVENGKTKKVILITIEYPKKKTDTVTTETEDNKSTTEAKKPAGSEKTNDTSSEVTTSTSSETKPESEKVVKVGEVDQDANWHTEGFDKRDLDKIIASLKTSYWNSDTFKNDPMYWTEETKEEFFRIWASTIKYNGVEFTFNKGGKRFKRQTGNAMPIEVKNQ